MDLPDLAFFESDDPSAYEGPLFQDFIRRWVWKRTRSYVGRLLAGMTRQGDRADVDEVTNEVHLKVQAKLDRSYIAQGSTPDDRFERFRRFVNTVATHAGITHARRLLRLDDRDSRFWRTTANALGGPAPPPELEDRSALTACPEEAVALARQLWPVLQCLSDTHLEILYFRIIGGYTFREIADFYSGQCSERLLCHRFADASRRARALLTMAATQARVRRDKS